MALPFCWHYAHFLASNYATPIPSTATVTPSLPQGVTNHGDPKLLCGPSSWNDIAIFILANYVAHAVTVRTKPGESAFDILMVMVVALLLPTHGVTRGIQSIYQAAIFAKTDLDAAKRAHALCAVVRTTGWQPHSKHIVEVLDEGSLDEYVGSSIIGNRSVRDENELSGWVNGTHEANESGPNMQQGSNHPILKRVKLQHHSLEADSVFSPSSKWDSIGDYRVHGVCVLPPGYALCIISPTVSVREVADVNLLARSHEPVVVNNSQAQATGINDQRRSFLSLSEQVNKPPTIKLSSNLNIPKALIAIFQFIYASVTLYKTKGDQVERYGFAAFGLTVIPYLIMTLVNLIGNVITPEYPKAYLMHSTIMDEAKQCAGARFEGIVGTIESPTDSLDALLEGSEDTLEGAAESHVILEPFTKHATPHSFKAVLEKDNIGRMLLFRGDKCPAEEVVFDAGDKIDNVKGTSPTTLEIAAGPDCVVKRTNEGPKALDWEAFFVGCLAFLIVGIMTHFKSGGSTLVQRGSTMMWIASGIGWRLGYQFLFQTNTEDGLLSTLERLAAESVLGNIALTLLYPVVYLAGRSMSPVATALALVPPIGGFVVVAQMLREYGTCIQISAGDE